MYYFVTNLTNWFTIIISGFILSFNISIWKEFSSISNRTLSCSKFQVSFLFQLMGKTWIMFSRINKYHDWTFFKNIYFKSLIYFTYKAMHNFFLNNSKVTIIKESEFVIMVPWIKKIMLCHSIARLLVKQCMVK